MGALAPSPVLTPSLRDGVVHRFVVPTLKGMKECLENDEMPPVGEAAMGGPCDFCEYAKSRTELTLKNIKSKS